MTSQENHQCNPDNKNNTKSLVNEKISRLFAKLAIPIAFGMLLSGLYNIVDAYFVALYIGPNAFAAVSAVFPFQMLIIAIAALISNGVSILLSQYWGAGKILDATRVINNAISVILIVAVALGLLGYFFTPEILVRIGVTELLLDDAMAYFNPITSGAILILTLSLISDIVRAQSNMPGLLFVILLGTVSNVFLDFLFIVVLSMGVFGAALATLVGQLLGVALGLALLKKHKGYLNNSTLSLGFNLSVIRRFLSLGLPVFISYVGAAIVMMVVNTIIAQQSANDAELTIGAYGIIARMNIFIILPLIAISHTCQTIIAHNYGAKNIFRVQKAAVTGAIIASGYLSLMTLCFYLFSGQIIGLFSNSEELIFHTQSIASIMFLMLPFSGISAICVFFSGIGKSKIGRAAFVSSSLCFSHPHYFIDIR